MQPRSAGKLHVGGVIYTRGVFSVEMVFEPREFFSAADEIKSAALTAQQLFSELLHLNGMVDFGPAEVVCKQTSGRAITIYMACKASKQKPAIIMVKDPEP